MTLSSSDDNWIEQSLKSGSRLRMIPSVSTKESEIKEKASKYVENLT
jgi:hypothetical protein